MVARAVVPPNARSSRPPLDAARKAATVTDEMLLQLADIKTDGNVVPPPTMTVEPRVIDAARAVASRLRQFPADATRPT